MTPHIGPLRRIFSTLLWYTLKAGSQEFRLSPTERGGFVVHFRVGEEWREEMKLPPYVQPTLTEYIKHGFGLPTEETELPQNCNTSVQITAPDQFIDWIFNLEVKIYPTELGERIHVLIREAGFEPGPEINLGTLPPFGSL